MQTQRFSIYPLPALSDNYIWLIINEAQRRVIAIDPGESTPLIDYLTKNQLKLDAILITHHHADHTQGIPDLRRHFNCPVYGPCYAITGVTQVIEENTPLLLPALDAPISIMNIPGHTLDHVAYHFSDKLFCGDTLFSAGCGRVFEGTMEQMYQSLQKISCLPKHTLIYCAHEYTLANLRFAQAVEPHNPNIQSKIQTVVQQRAMHHVTLPSTLEEELNTNPFLRCKVSEVIEQAERHTGTTLESPIDVFTALRHWKNHF